MALENFVQTVAEVIGDRFGPGSWRERDDGHLVKPARPLTAIEELARIANEAQERDTEDEHRLYDPMLRDRSSFQQRRRSAVNESWGRSR